MGQETAKTNISGEKKRGLEAPIWGAIITAMAMIIVALIGSPVFEKWLAPTPAPLTTPDLSAPFSTSSPVTFTAITSPTGGETILPTETSTAGIIPTNTVAPVLPAATATPTSSLAAAMYVIVAANPTIGDAPLTVKLDARGSYVVAPDGTRFECRLGACHYTWYIYLNGQEFARPDASGGTLDFKFQKKGTYFISVYICHGAKSPTCGSGGTVVTAN
jgi:hypothetical protein